METLGSLETADESSENSGIVKSEDGSPTVGSGRSSPPPNCAICLGRCRNKSFTDSCLHQFCFKCLLTWSRVKTECPLCKQIFKSIIHNVKSNHQYEEYRVQQPQSEDRGPAVDYGAIFNATAPGRFRYRTTLTLPRRETMAIRQFLLHYPLTALMSELPARSAPRERTRRSPADFRRTVYRHNLWARPLPDFTGRFRDCSPEFFRYNDSQVHRLVPWLSRELHYLLHERSTDVTYVLSRILELLPEHHITSERFRAELRPLLGAHTEHFLHEFYCFAATPYDITGYDRHVQYRTEPPAGVGATVAPGLVSEVLSSSDTDSHDSDIMMVSSSHEAGPSRAPAPAPTPVYPQPAVIPIETISHSDSDGSEVMVVGYVKPPHQRTPELVDLLASDSDVVVQEVEEPPPAPAAPPPAPPNDQLVRIKLAITPRARSLDTDSSADERRSLYTPPLPAPRRRRRARAPSSYDDIYTPSPAEYSSTDEYDSGDTSTSSSEVRRKRTTRRKPKRKRTRGSRSRGRAERAPRRARDDEAATGDRKPKGKSKDGKNVKSSKVDLTEKTVPTEVARDQSNESVGQKKKKKTKRDRAGPSGLRDGSRRKRSTELPLAEQAGPSGLATGSKRKKSEDSADLGGVEKSSKRKRHLEPAGLEGSGLNTIDHELETKRPEPTLALDSADLGGVGKSSKRKRHLEPAGLEGFGLNTIDNELETKRPEPTPALDSAGPSGVGKSSKRKRHVEPAALERPGLNTIDNELETKRPEPTPALDSAGPSGVGKSSKRKRHVEPAALERPGLNTIDNELETKRHEPTPALDCAGPSGAGKISKRKRHLEPPALERPGSSTVDNELETKRPELTPALNRLGVNGLIDGQKKTESSPSYNDASDIDDWWRRSEELISPFLEDHPDVFNRNKGVEHVSRRSSRDTHENKRLKSVVKVIKRDVSESSGNGSVKRDHYSDTSASRLPHKPDNLHISPQQTHTDRGYSSSDDNIPLHLTVSNPYTLSRTYVSDFSD